MVVHLMKTIVFYINAFVWQPGISRVMPPITIVEGTILDFNIHFPVIFGKFVHTYEGTHNNMTPRTVKALALDPAINNLQGVVHCFSLYTGKILTRTQCDIYPHKWTELALKRINHINKNQKSVQGILFANGQKELDQDNVVTGVVDDINNNINNNNTNFNIHLSSNDNDNPIPVSNISKDRESPSNANKQAPAYAPPEDSPEDNPVDEDGIAPENAADKIQPLTEETRTTQS